MMYRKDHLMIGIFIGSLFGGVFSYIIASSLLNFDHVTLEKSYWDELQQCELHIEEISQELNYCEKYSKPVNVCENNGLLLYFFGLFIGVGTMCFVFTQVINKDKNDNRNSHKKKNRK